ncbi:UvrD-helicase domain-containing protein [Pelistega ratti]|uniref:UvrD-helicase domain-containing protein n=1 Tax=Pelistega ratti TaxID=2652177 RepID=UPI0013583672|nr:UvrD-helicase domain-containing protein [Pelistega ratti]
MKALLVEGVAGSGKTSYIADTVQHSLNPNDALLLTFSRTGYAVLQQYLESRQVKNSTVYTIDGFAMRILRQLGDTRFILRREEVERELLPLLYQQVVAQIMTSSSMDIAPPAPITPSTMQALMSDIDFFRASCAFEYHDDDMLEEILLGKLHHDWRLVRRVFYAYDNYRETWRPSPYQSESVFEHDEISSSYQQGEQGFRLLSESVFDLLQLIEDSEILARIGKKYRLQCIDEFHDTTPLQLKFLLQLNQQAQTVIAVGDRFQNIFAWRGTNTSFVFDQFVRQLNAETEQINRSYRYAQNIANLASSIIHRPIQSLAEHSSTIKTLSVKELTKISKETLIITKDFPTQMRAAFTLFSQTNHKLALGINHSIAPAILNILMVLRYPYLLNTKAPHFSKNLALDLTQFLQLPQCLLDETAKQEILHKPSMESIRMYFDIHLQENRQKAYDEHFRQALLYWCATNQENTPVYEVMQWLEQSARLWQLNTHRIYDQISRASWEGLKADARQYGYTLAQWQERAIALSKRWNEREGLRFATISQAKGREYNQVLFYGVSKEGFDMMDELSQHLFYVGITRAKKTLYFYLDDSVDAKAIPQAITHLSPDTTVIDHRQALSINGITPSVSLSKAEALKQLRQMREALLEKNRIESDEG